MPTQPQHYRWQGEDLLLQVRITPRASREQVNGLLGDWLKVAITAPPVDGKANRHLTKFIAKRFRVPASHVTIVKGRTGRQKILRVARPDHLPEDFRVARQ